MVTARRATATLLIAGWALMLAMNAPGQLSYDSVTQLADGRAGLYNSWHPPVMAWLLGLFDSLVPGTFLFLLFQSLLVLGAFLALLWLSPRGWMSVLVAAAIVLTPQWLLYQGEIWKDILFTGAALAGFAGLAWYARTRHPAALIASGVLLTLAACARQNGLVLLPVAAVTLWLIARRQGRTGWTSGWISGWRYALAFLLATLALTAMVGFALSFRGDGGEGAGAELRLGQSYDLAGALARRPGLSLPLADDPGLESALRGRGRTLYSPLGNDPFAADPAINHALANTPDGAVAHAWRALVLEHPLLYLRVRWAAFAAVLLTPDPLICHFAVAGVTGPTALDSRLGLKPGLRPQDRALAAYARPFFATPVFSHLAWGALAIGLFVVLLKRGSPPDLAVAGLLAGALLFVLSFAVISIACDYRYLVFLDFAAMAASVYTIKKSDGLLP
jgi:hypothetical protein